MSKIGDIFSGGIKVGEVWEDNSGYGCFGLLFALVLVLAALAWLLENTDALLGILFLLSGSFLAGRSLNVLCRSLTDRSYTSRLPPSEARILWLAGLVLTGFGYWILTQSSMADFFVLILAVIAAFMLLPIG
jgi:hypothetical protein